MNDNPHAASNELHDAAATAATTTTTVDATTSSSTTVGTPEESCASGSGNDTMMVNNNSKNSNNDNKDDDDYNFMKDMLHSLPPMKHEELENIVQQTNELLGSLPITVQNDDSSNDTSSSSLWTTHVIDPFWKEYQSRTCRHSVTVHAKLGMGIHQC